MSASERKPRVLVDDDVGMRESMAVILEADGFDVTEAPDGGDGLQRLAHHSYEVVLLDIQMPGLDGMEVLRRIREKWPDVTVLMVTVLKEIPKVVEAIKLGAFDFITKDFRPSELQLKVHQALEHRRTVLQMAYLADEVARTSPGDMVMGSGPAMARVAELVQKVAPLPATVLVLGESGTGKELLARRIHQQWCAAMGGRERPFVTVNLAAIPADLMESALFGHEKGAFTGATQQQYGKFQLADGGTLFLDEIGELRLDLQAKLLRAIQEREIERVGGRRPVPVNVRLVAATNVDLGEAVEKGTFREDLYYRINVIPIRLPPLRERIEDIPDLASHFVRKYARRFRKPVTGLTPRAVEVLQLNRWPGNVRELENLVERLVAMSDKDVLDEVDIPLDYAYPRILAEARRRKEDGLVVAMEAFERAFIAQTLERTGWLRKAAAAELGIGYSTLKKKMKKLGLTPPGVGEDDDEDERGG